MFAALERRPGLLAAVRSVEVKLPEAREGLFKAHVRSLGFGNGMTLSFGSSREVIKSADPWVGMVDIAKWLGRFEMMTSVHVVVTMEKREPRELEGLWDFAKVCAGGLSVEWVVPRTSLQNVRDLEWSVIWRAKWEEFLRVREESDFLTAVRLTESTGDDT